MHIFLNSKFLILVSNEFIEIVLIKLFLCIYFELLSIIRFLNSAIKTDKIRSQDVRSVFAGVSANPAGFQMAWRQLQMYWPTLMAKFGEGSFTIGSIIQTTISHFSTDFDYKGK